MKSGDRVITKYGKGTIEDIEETTKYLKHKRYFVILDSCPESLLWIQESSGILAFFESEITLDRDDI